MKREMKREMKCDLRREMKCEVERGDGVAIVILRCESMRWPGHSKADRSSLSICTEI